MSNFHISYYFTSHLNRSEGNVADFCYCKAKNREQLTQCIIKVSKIKQHVMVGDKKDINCRYVIGQKSYALFTRSTSMLNRF